MKLKNVIFKDLTESLTAEDTKVKQELTSILPSIVYQLDQSLSLTGWESFGFGDFVLMAEWGRNFNQQKPALKNVFLTARGGLNLPTGVKKNEDQLLSIPFGFDGSAGIIFGGGLILDWYQHLSGGLDFEFTYLFGNTRTRRIRIDALQTDFLLLAKQKVYTDYGFTQRYNLFLSVNSLCIEGLSLKCIYQFFKHGDDTYSLCSNQYTEILANDTISSQGWTMQHLIFKVDYDLQYLLCNNKTGLKPQVSFFTKIPVNGERAIMFSTVGMTMTFNF